MLPAGLEPATFRLRVKKATTSLPFRIIQNSTSIRLIVNFALTILSKYFTIIQVFSPYLVGILVGIAGRLNQ